MSVWTTAVTRSCSKANEEAVQILKEAKDLADETIRNFNKYGQGQAPMVQNGKRTQPCT